MSPSGAAAGGVDQDILSLLIGRAGAHGDRTAIVARDGTYSYRDLLAVSARVARALLQGRSDLQGERVAFLIPPSFDHVAVQWGIWRAGGVAVPLCVSHPRPELEYVVDDCGASVLVAAPELADRLRPIVELRGLTCCVSADLRHAPTSALPHIDPGRPAMIVYTSGTTGGPKGVVTTHDNIRAQIESLVTAWEWRSEDRVLLVLPLHHVHGIINVLCCALWSGAVCEMMPEFDPAAVWRRFVCSPLTLFMAVPTIYARMLAAWEAAPAEQRSEWSTACTRFRLMVSGSAALPARILERWREISGHTLLERYGMTEIGMALSNPLRGERRAGYVGQPLPGVEVRLVDGEGRPVGPAEPGEIEVRGTNVFKEYWGRPRETGEAFRDGWFRSGDMAVVEAGSYRILGRQSADIIKSGGFKVSALEVEEVLREHPSVGDCAVVAIPDEEWGERVAAAVVLSGEGELSLEELRSWAKRRLAPYKVPTRLEILESLPRNPMGKVVKPELVARMKGSGS